MGYRDTTAYKIAKAVFDKFIKYAPDDILKNVKYKSVGIVPSLEEQNFPAILVAAEVTNIVSRGIQHRHVYGYDVVLTYITKSRINDINAIYEELERVDKAVVEAVENESVDGFGLSSDYNIIFYPVITVSNSFEIRDYPKMNETYIVYRTYTLRCEVMENGV